MNPSSVLGSTFSSPAQAASLQSLSPIELQHMRVAKQAGDKVWLSPQSWDCTQIHIHNQNEITQFRYTGRWGALARGQAIKEKNMRVSWTLYKIKEGKCLAKPKVV